MKLNKPVFSYTDDNDGLLKATLIKSIESLTGRGALHSSYAIAQKLMDTHDIHFWEAAIKALKLTLDYNAEQLNKIPRTGPLVVVANHPFGVVDGLIIGCLISKVRPDFKIMTNSMLCQANDLAPYLLPADFAPTKAARNQNLATRKQAKIQVAEGKALVLFPAGGVSTTKGFTFKALDAPWQVFTSELVHSAKAPVVPIYFHGQNSLLFQWVSQVSVTLRLALLIYEAYNKIGTVKKMDIGDPIYYRQLSNIKNRKKLVNYLRAETFGLSKNLKQKVPVI